VVDTQIKHAHVIMQCLEQVMQNHISGTTIKGYQQHEVFDAACHQVLM